MDSYVQYIKIMAFLHTFDAKKTMH